MGPLKGVRIVEFEGIGPGPMCAMLLADLGADVIRLSRPTANGLGVYRPERYDFLRRNRTALPVDLKTEAGRETAREFVSVADALIEGFRPGVMERLGFGPDECLKSNPRLVYGRMTGWGQDGPLSHAAGHDLNYISVAGALHSIGRSGQPPTPPLNLVGDFGGGTLYLALGIVAALYEVRTSGRGQVVDAAMVDGVASLMTAFHGLHAAGEMRLERGSNVLDSGAFYYDCYECSDGKWISVAALEPKFYRTLLQLLEIDESRMPPREDRSRWPEGRAILAACFAGKTRDEWCTVLEGTDACVAPVLDLEEAPRHPHMAARGVYVEVGGLIQPAPAPRFSRTPLADPAPASTSASANDLLRRWQAQR